MARLVVLADSLSFHGPSGPLPLADARLYPNALRARLAAATGGDWQVSTVAFAGWSLREVWVALQKDVHLQQEVLLHADAVVLAVGSTDSLSVGVPRPVMVALPYVRPTSLRRRARRAIARTHPALVRLTGGRLHWTPPSVYAHAWRKSAAAIRLFAPQAALCATLPAVHRGAYYAGRHPHRERYAALTRALAAEAGVPVVDLAALVLPWLDRLNPDGLHWPFEMHADVADALAAALLPQLPASGADAGPPEDVVDERVDHGF